eukprot:scaffold113112_cov28-Prasinocladus_malaysianus.AAC.1
MLLVLVRVCNTQASVAHNSQAKAIRLLRPEGAGRPGEGGNPPNARTRLKPRLVPRVGKAPE